MTDLREGRIQAFLDGELDEPGRIRFMDDMNNDPALAAAVRRQKERIARVGAALDHSAPEGVSDRELDEAWEYVSNAASGSGQTARPSLELATGSVGRDDRMQSARRGRFPVSLAKAAALLLLATGVGAATVPGSPLRAWIAEWYGPVEGNSAVGGEPAAGPETVGLRLPATGEGVEVSVAGPLSSPLSVSLTDGGELEVVAVTGTRFATSRGRIEVSQVHGPLEVRVPRELAQLTLVVDGEPYLRKSGEEVEILRAGVDSLPAEFVFTPVPNGDTPVPNGESGS